MNTQANKNSEPYPEDFNKNPNLYTWAYSKRNETITNDMFINFFRHIFQLLEENNTCFASGAFVFENYGNVLFNLITYNKLLIDNGSYECKNPLALIQNKDPNVYVLGTLTHKKVYDKNKLFSRDIFKVKPRECMPNPLGIKKNTKFERVFNPRIKNICGFCKPPHPEGKIYSEPKGVLLYYPFTSTSTTFPIKNAPKEENTTVEFLFVKFEGASVSEDFWEHSGNLGKKVSGKQLETAEELIKRREDEPYNADLERIDKEIYRNNCKEDIPILEWYNTYLRTGREFFVSRGLLTKFLQYLFLPFSCPATITKPVAMPSQIPPRKSFITSASEGYKDFNNQFQGMNLNYGGKKRKLNKKTKKNKKSRKSRKSRKYY
jgi:hypothetical protein